MSLLKADAFRSFVFILLGSGSLWFFATGKLTRKYLLPGLILVILIDLWGVDRRYINNTHFVPARQIRQQFTQSEADKSILNDKDPNFRVFAIYRNPFSEVNTSYFHKSIGGYHGAKLQRYQDLIDHYLAGDYQSLVTFLQENQSIEGFDDLLSTMPVVNMLNTRYIIVHPEMPAVFNPYAMGNAWLVQDVKMVTSVKDELFALQTEDLHKTAVIHADFAPYLENVTIGTSGGSIGLTAYHPEQLTYQANVDTPQLAVFSEIFYPAGWKAYINGEEVPVLRADYLLRAVPIPAGESTIEFRFEPASYHFGKMLAALGSLVILGLIGLYVYRRKMFIE